MKAYIFVYIFLECMIMTRINLFELDGNGNDMKMNSQVATSMGVTEAPRKMSWEEWYVSDRGILDQMFQMTEVCESILDGITDYENQYDTIDYYAPSHTILFDLHYQIIKTACLKIYYASIAAELEWMKD